MKSVALCLPLLAACYGAAPPKPARIPLPPPIDGAQILVHSEERTTIETVQKAYRELEREGLVEARRGVGTFVVRSLGRGAGVPDGELRADLVAWTQRARAAGLEREDVEALTKSVIDEQF